MTEEQFDELIHDACEAYVKEEAEKFLAIDTTDVHEPSKRFKLKMNRLFRERVGGNYIPHPEVDNWFERARSWAVVRWMAHQDKKKTEYK